MVGSERVSYVYYDIDDSLRGGPVEAETGLGREVCIERVDEIDFWNVRDGYRDGGRIARTIIPDVKLRDSEDRHGELDGGGLGESVVDVEAQRHLVRDVRARVERDSLRSGYDSKLARSVCIIDCRVQRTRST